MFKLEINYADGRIDSIIFEKTTFGSAHGLKNSGTSSSAIGMTVLTSVGNPESHFFGSDDYLDVSRLNRDLTFRS